MIINTSAADVSASKKLDKVEGNEGEGDSCKLSPQAIMGFAIAIIVHSVIDGLAIGVFDQPETLVVLAIGVIIHKIPVACSVGQTFQNGRFTLKEPFTIIFFILFILSSPLGMVIGM